MVGLKSLALMATICGCVPALAAESRPLAAADYRLTVEKPDAFRLTPKETAALRRSRARNPRPPRARRQALRRADRSRRAKPSLDPALVHAVIYVESGYNPAARSPKGALGLMQVMPDTAARYGVRRSRRVRWRRT